MKKIYAFSVFYITTAVVWAASKTGKAAAASSRSRFADVLKGKILQPTQDFLTRLFTQDMPFKDVCCAKVLLWGALITVAFLSAAFSIELARKKNRNPLLFFLAGAILPVVAPVILFFAVKPNAQNLKLIVKSNKSPGEVPKGWNQEYFQYLAMRKVKSSEDVGPWELTYNGVTVEVQDFVEVQGDFMTVRVKNKVGQVITARVPFAKIQDFNEIS